MALKDDLGDLEEGFKRIQEMASDSEGVFTSMASIMGQLANSSQDYGDELKSAVNIAKQLSSKAKALAGYDAEALKDKTTLNKVNKQAKSLAEDRNRLEAKIRVLRSKTLNATEDEKKILDKINETLTDATSFTNDISGGFNEILQTQEKIEDSNPFKPLADFVKDIPVLNKFLDNMVSAANKFNEEMADSGNKQKALIAGFKEYGKLISKATAALTIGFIRKGILYADEASTQLGRSLNLTVDEANNLDESLNNAASSMSGITGLELKQSLLEFNSEFGLTVQLSDKTLETMSRMKKELGLSSQQANTLSLSAASVGKNLDEVTQSAIGQVRAQNAQNGLSIDYKSILKDIANVSAATRVSIQGQGKSLAKAAFEARKLGLTLDQIEGIQSSLLDFESSIANELEAELILGKELNFEKARQLALNNDLEGVAKEMKKQEISLAYFRNLNFVAQESLAKSIGMSRNDLAKSLEIQAAQENLSKKGLNTTAKQNAYIKRRLREINKIGDLTKREEARAAFMNELGSEALVNQQEQRSLTELQAEAAQSIVEAFGFLRDILRPIEGVIKGIAENANLIVKPLMLITGALLIRRIITMAKLFGGMARSSGLMASNIMKSTKMGGPGGAGGGMNMMPGGGKMGTRGFNPLTMSYDKAGRAQYNRLGRSVTGQSGFVKGIGKAGKMARMGSKFAKASPLALLGGLALDYGADKLKESGQEGLGKATSVASGTLSGAATGAMIGSIIPGIGTAVGGVVGGLIGGVTSAMSEYGEENTETSENSNDQIAKALNEQTKQLTVVLNRNRTVSLNTVNLQNRQSFDYRTIN